MKTKGKANKSILFLLAAVIMLTLFAILQTKVHASDADELTFQINHQYQHGGSGTLTATQSGNTVTITGSVENISKTLNLSIDSGVRVIWKARVSGWINGLINLSGSGNGSFELAEGSYIVSDKEITIYNPPSSACSIIVNGGILENLGTNGIAIRSNAANSNITVSGNSDIYAGGIDGTAISVVGSGSSVTVSGGKVVAGSNSTYGNAIYCGGANSVVNVKGGMVSAMRDAINISGANSTVNVSGGTVSAGEESIGSGIYLSSSASNAKVNVSGGSFISAGNGKNHAICSDGSNSLVELSGGSFSTHGALGTVNMRATTATVIVGGKAEVENTGAGDTITGNSLEVYVKGGSVSSAKGNAILSYRIDMSGGRVTSAGTGSALAALFTNISGGTVKAKGSGHAIESQTVDISGGTVSARSGPAVQVGGAGSVNISNGFVFAFGTSSDITPNVIQMDFGALPQISGSAVVCVLVNPGGKPVFTEGTSTQLSANAGASVSWGQKGSEAGINYLNGQNKGFFPLDGIVIIAAPATTTTTTKTTKTTTTTTTKASNLTAEETADTISETLDTGISEMSSAAETKNITEPAGDETLTLPYATIINEDESGLSFEKTTGSFIKNFKWLWILLIALAAAVIIAVVLFLILRKKKR